MTDITGTNKERYDKTIRRREKLSGYFFDMSKLVFTTMVVANLILPPDVMTNRHILMTVFGLLMTITFAWWGNSIMKF